MTKRRRRTNLGIVLLFILVVGVVIFCVIDESKFYSRKDAAREKGKEFIAGLAEVCTWPKDMPDIDALDIERDPEKYLTYFDAGMEKVRPHIYNSKALEKELKNYALSFVRDYLVIGEKPVKVTFDSQFAKVIIKKDTAQIKGVINSKATVSKGVIKEKQINFNLNLEYQNDNWVVVDYMVEQW